MKSGLVLFVVVLVGNWFVVSNSAVIKDPPHNRPDTTIDWNRRDDYIYTPGMGAHKIHTTMSTWSRAWETCRNEGGHLAIINSYPESRLVGRLLREALPYEGSSSPHAHVGIHNLFSRNNWVTLDGQSLAVAGFSEWTNGEPNNKGGNERCGSIKSDGKLNDVSCEEYLCGFICEIAYVESKPVIPQSENRRNNSINNSTPAPEAGMLS